MEESDTAVEWRAARVRESREPNLLMKIRLLPVFLVAGISAGCATTNYQSPAPTRAEVAEAQAQIENLHPDRASLSLAEATDLATPVFEAIADDAARICRTVSEADSCLAPSFDIEDVEHVNAHAGFDREGRPMISLTRGLVEHLADRPDQLAMVIGHEYGHLITAHIEESDRRACRVEDFNVFVQGVICATRKSNGIIRIISGMIHDFRNTDSQRWGAIGRIASLRSQAIPKFSSIR